jgi:hypothetical protein
MGCPVMYYTYAHYSPDGQVFYIGKGIDDRAFSFGDRSKVWKQAVKYYKGLKIEIIAYWNTEEEAFKHEMELIAHHKNLGADLVNLTDGGRGPFRVKVSNERKAYMSLLLKGRKYELVTCNVCGKKGGRTAMKRWHFDKCTGTHDFKARVTINGKRTSLGRFSTQEEANQACLDAYAKANKPVPKEFYLRKGL